jgi:hypothetical protein
VVQGREQLLPSPADESFLLFNMQSHVPGQVGTRFTDILYLSRGIHHIHLPSHDQPLALFPARAQTLLDQELVSPKFSLLTHA